MSLFKTELKDFGDGAEAWPSLLSIGAWRKLIQDSKIELGKLTVWLFPFDRRRRFGADVVTDSIDAGDFIDDSRRHFGEHVVGQSRPIGRHEIVGIDAANDECIFVGSGIAHHSDTLDRQQNGKQLGCLSIKAGFSNFVDHDRVGFTQDFQFRLGDLAQATNGQVRARETDAAKPDLRASPTPDRAGELRP